MSNREYLEKVCAECPNVFVYGTLKRGHRANMKLARETFMGVGVTKDTFAVFGQGFPMALFYHKGHPLRGEVYRIENVETFGRLDYYEGYPSFYNRTVIDVLLGDETVKAWIYFIPGSYFPGRLGVTESHISEYRRVSTQHYPGNDGIIDWGSDVSKGLSKAS